MFCFFKKIAFFFYELYAIVDLLFFFFFTNFMPLLIYEHSLKIYGSTS